MNAIITGAGKGIGKEISFKLAGLGYDLLIISRNKATLEQTKLELLDTFPSILVETFSADLSTMDWMEEFTKLHFSKAPDVLINNVGGYFEDQASHMDNVRFSSLFQLNFLSAVEISKIVLPQMKKKKVGFVINICSVAALSPRVDAASYSISKAALNTWGQLLRKELAKENIKVSNIYPGSVATPSWDGNNADLTKMIQTEDIANAVGFILGLSEHSNCDEIHLSPLKEL